MSLPKIDVPIYELSLPSDGKTIKIRPFLVKEEKLLLMAVESNDIQNIIKTTKQVINNCILEKKLDIEKLPFFDIDYLFIALRAKSIGESIEVSYTCNHDTENGRCGGTFETSIDISKCEVEKDPEAKDTIELSDKITMKMKYPTYDIMKLIMSNETVIERKLRIIMSCVDKIVTQDKIYTQKDFTKEELKRFLEDLTQDQYKKLEHFIDNFPTFYVKADAKCPKCGFVHDIKYQDFARFFQ
jgi:hypothetical protein